MLSGKQIILLLVLEASIIGIAMSDTNNTSVENMTIPVDTDTAVPNVADTATLEATVTVTSTPTVTLTSTPIVTATSTPIATVTATSTPIVIVTSTPVATVTSTPTITATSTPTPSSGKRATVIVTFDDGWLSVYDKAYPIMQANNQKGVAFVNVEPILGGWPDFVSQADISTMYNSGWDISSHTYSHVDLTLQNATLLKHELTDSKTWLDQSGYTRSSNFLAYPYGMYNNPAVLAAVKNAGYLAARTVDPTTNYQHYTLNSPDILTMKNYEAIGGIDNDATIITQINNAIAVNGLLILSFHKIVDTLSPDADNASTEFKVSDFQIVSTYLKNSNVDVRTLSDYFGVRPIPVPTVTPTPTSTPTPTPTPTPTVTNATPTANTTPIVMVTSTPAVTNATPTPTVTNATPAVTVTSTPTVTTTPNLAKYTSESRGSSSGYYIVEYRPPAPAPTPNTIQTPIPTATPDFNQVVTTVGNARINEVVVRNEDVVRNEEQPKGLFGNIIDYLKGMLNHWREYFG